VKAGAEELEARFGFRGEIVRVQMQLVENNPLGADPVPTLRNVYYGPHVRQKLDVYPAQAAAPTPVRSRMVKELMRQLGDRISGGRRGARGFGSSPMNCRSDLLLPGIGSRCPY